MKAVQPVPKTTAKERREECAQKVSCAKRAESQLPQMCRKNGFLHIVVPMACSC